jgi:tetratricopeptide (TPR) repeat protein
MTCPTNSRQRFWSFAIALTLFTFVSGCATRGRGFQGRFVKRGDPSVSLDAPKTEVKPKPVSLGEYARRLRTIQANARTTINIGNVLESRDPVLAAALLKLSMFPNAATHREVAQIYATAGITDFAYRHWQRALQLEPCDASAFEGLARLWRQWGAPELALGDAYRAVHCRPHSASAYNTLGTVMVALGQLENAKKAFEFALRLDDRAAFVLNNLCYVALQEGDGRPISHSPMHFRATSRRRKRDSWTIPTPRPDSITSACCGWR